MFQRFEPRQPFHASNSRAFLREGVMTGETPKLLNVNEAAERLGVSVSYLNKMRLTGGGPPFVKLGARVCYDQSDLSAWIESQKRRSTSDVAEAAP